MGKFSFREYANAWNSKDQERVARFFADSAVYEDRGVGSKHEGREAIKEYVGAMTTMAPDFQIEVFSDVNCDQQIAAEWVMTGTNSGGGGGLPATGTKFTVRACSIGKLNDEGQLEKIADCWNLADVMAQMGLLPAPRAAAE